MPTTAPPDTVVWNADSTIGLSRGDLPGTYTSTLTGVLGFELALVYGVTVRQSDARAELQRVVADHDHPAVDVLVVSVNATIRQGLYFPSTQVMADLVLDDPDPLADMTLPHLNRVALHDAAEPGRIRWLVGTGLPT